MIHEDILNEKIALITYDELALKLYAYIYIKGNPEKRIAFWNYTYQTKKLTIDFEKMLGIKFIPTYIINNFKHYENCFF